MRCVRAVLSVALLLLPAAALAQGFQKPIRIIVPFAPGASADGIARAIANDLAARRGKPVVIENNVGAGGSLGSRRSPSRLLTARRLASAQAARS
jgi:tripartite-type tricarboxylate transporter receptor subunit TctC